MCAFEKILVLYCTECASVCKHIKLSLFFHSLDILDMCKRNGTDTLETGDWGSGIVGHNFYYNWWLLKEPLCCWL